MTSDGVSSLSRVGWTPGEHVTGLEIDLDADQCQQRVFSEAARVLRPGGRLAIADIVSASPLKEVTRRNTELWAACIAGAIPVSAYVDALTEAGFAVTARRRNDYRFVSERALTACSTYGVQSISLAATRAAS